MASKRQIQMKEIPFYDNFFTYLQLKALAKERGISYGAYMADLLLAYCANNNYTHPERIHTGKTYHEVIKMIAATENVPIAQVIEKMALEAIGQTYVVKVAGSGVVPVAKSVEKKSFTDRFRLPTG